jgi:putative oxidoreductase
MLLLRLSFGGLMLFNHGLNKLMKFATLQNEFYNFLGIGSRTSLLLNLFAEIFCSLLVVLGLFTRVAVIPLIIAMLVVIFSVDAKKPFLESELAILFFTAFVTLLLCGPGKISIDGMMDK